MLNAPSTGGASNHSAHGSDMRLCLSPCTFSEALHHGAARAAAKLPSLSVPQIADQVVEVPEVVSSQGHFVSSEGQKALGKTRSMKMKVRSGQSRHWMVETTR